MYFRLRFVCFAVVVLVIFSLLRLNMEKNAVFVYNVYSKEDILLLIVRLS